MKAAQSVELGVFDHNIDSHSPARTHDPQSEIPDQAASPIGVGEEDATLTTDKTEFSPGTKRTGRLIIFIVCVAFLIIGRFSVPDNEVPCVEDKIHNALKFANDFINKQGNEIFRNMFQGLCSFLVDTVFLITFGYWVLRGSSTRLPLTLALFYFTRALIQALFFSPFPPGFYWDSPGWPSLVVPYGRGSDFFYSGHSGFLIICVKEWNKVGNRLARNYAVLVASYTIFILLVYRIHYSIDIFAGVFYADWCFERLDGAKDKIDPLISNIASRVKEIFVKKNGIKLKSMDSKSLVNA